MKRLSWLVGLALLVPGVLLPPGAAASDEATLRGWFSDLDCASARAAGGRFGPTGLECARKCLAKGVKLAFIDERAKAVFVVDNPKVGKALLGDHVEVAVTRTNGNTLHVVSARVLERYVAKCDAR